MMDRRGFLGRMVLGAVVALHAELPSFAPILIPPIKVEKWWYLIEETTPALHTYTTGTILGYLKKVRWIDEEEMKALGLKHEDFEERESVGGCGGGEPIT